MNSPNDIRENILIVFADAPAGEALRLQIESLGCTCTLLEAVSPDVDLTEAPCCAVAIVDAAIPQCEAFIASMQKRLPEMEVVVAAPKGDIEAAMGRFQDLAYEFLPYPASATVLSVMLRRIRRPLRVVGGNPLSETRVKKMIGDERFLAVWQIVEKMSSFIAQISNDVQGGVRYFNELPYFVSVHDRKGNVLAANRIYEKYLHKAPCARSWDIYVGKRAAPQACPLGRTLRSGEPMTTHALVRYRSGAKIPVIVHTAPIRNQKGEIELVLEVFAGSREIEKLAEEVRNTEQRYRQLFNDVPCMIAVLDERFRITAINQRFKENFGEKIGKNFFDIFRPGRFPPYRDPIVQSFRDTQPHTGEMVLTSQNGTQYNMMARTAPIITPSNRLSQVLVMFTDVTEKRRLKDNLSALGLMVGTVSHSLKGSLTGLDAALYLIDTGFYRSVPARIEEGLDVAKLMVERIRKLVLNVLFYSKERKLETEIVDIIEFAGDLAANMDNKIRAANIRFVFDVAPDAGRFTVDTGLLRSALINVLENAIEACIEDRRDIAHEIRFVVTPEDGFVLFKIADNANGMDELEKKRIFNLFYSSKGNRGTGIGLFVTREVLTKHGGTIHAESMRGSGTCFYIRVPRIEDTAGQRHRRMAVVGKNSRIK